jgi:hypothetical protein
MKSFFQKLSDAQKLIAAVALILLISVLVFLFNADGGYSGWQILKQEGAGFWIVAIISVVIIYFLANAMVKRYEKTQEGGSTTAYLIAIAVFLAIAFGKGCTDKANGGVTTSQGRPAATK